MKQTKKIIATLILLLLITVLAFLILKTCNNRMIDKSGFYEQTSKTSQSSKSSSTKSSASTKKSSSSASKKTNQESSVSESSDQTIGQASETQSSNNTLNSSNSEGTDVPAQGGVTQVDSGTLELTQDTPVYAEPDKNSAVIFTQPKGELNWDSYSSENGEFWYSFVLPGEGGGTRYYIAYSDVGH